MTLDSATYSLGSAGNTFNTNPAAGDVALGQLFASGGTVTSGDSLLVVTTNLSIDRAIAVAGDYSVFLNMAGDSTISGLTGDPSNGDKTDFTSTPGTLSLTQVPEPGAWAFMLLTSIAAVGVRFGQRRFLTKKTKP